MCPPGYIMSSNNCVKRPYCPRGSTYDLTSKTCKQTMIV